MPKRPIWSTPLPRPMSIPQVMTLKTLADVRELLSHIPTERRLLATWQHVENQLSAAATGGDVRDLVVPLMLVLQLESVPYTVAADGKGRKQ